MSDFGELCPLFNTGVFNEVTFTDLAMTALTGTIDNALVGTLTFTKVGNFTFGRTVVVTGAFVRNRVKPTAAMIMQLQHRTSQIATGTQFATLAISITASGVEVYSWIPMNTVTNTTFTSDEILAFCTGTGTASGAGTYDLMIRYKEK